MYPVVYNKVFKNYNRNKQVRIPKNNKQKLGARNVLIRGVNKSGV